MIKFLPYPLICPQEIENWLNEMSKNGYHLKKLFRTFATFEKGKCKDVKYYFITYVDFAINKADLDRPTPKDANASEYLDKGWHLLQKRVRIVGTENVGEHYYYYIYKSDADNPERYADKDKETKKTMDKCTLNTFKVLTIFTYAVGVIAYPYILINFKFARSIYSITDLYFHLPAMLMLTMLLALSFYKYFKLKRLAKYIEGKKEKPKRPIKKLTLLTAVIWVLCILVFVFYRPNKPTMEKETVYLGDIDNLVNLEVIEGEHSENLPADLLDDYYEGYSNSALLMPVYYEFDESIFDDENNIYAYAGIKHIRTSFPWNINRVYKEWPYYHFSNYGDIKTTSAEYFYEIKYCLYNGGETDYEGVYTYKFLLHSKHELIEIYYTGERTPEEVIANVEKLFIDE